MTGEDIEAGGWCPAKWDMRWRGIRDQALAKGALPTEAEAIADVDTVEQFGPRPGEAP